MARQFVVASGHGIQPSGLSSGRTMNLVLRCPAPWVAASPEVSTHPTGPPETPVPPPPDPFPSIPGYRILAELGRGGMGVVYEAIDTGLNRPVALKLISDVLETDQDSLARLRDEAEAVARLEHPNVVRIYRVGEHRGRPFLALELIPGGSLARRLSDGPLDIGMAVDLVRAVALGVHHAHTRGVIHRDLKPGNILLGQPETGVSPGSEPTPIPKVTDFGIAKMLDNDQKRTRTGMFVGTLLYIAPELIDNPRAASPASDVYSLGVILYECLTGLLPIVGKSFIQTVHLIQEVEALPPSRHRQGIPRGLDTVCLKALAKSPSDRYPTPESLAADLERVLAGRRVRGPGVHLGRFVRPVVRNLVWVTVLSALLVAVLVKGRYQDAVAATRSGQELITRGEFAEAEAVTARGLKRVAGIPGFGDTANTLDHIHRTARRGRLAGELHRLLDRLRFEYDADALAIADCQKLAVACDALWAARDQLARSEGDLGDAREVEIRTDLLDLVLLSADLRSRADGRSPEARQSAVERLDEAERFLGVNPVLALVRESIHTGVERTGADPRPDASAWELHAIGRFRLNHGDPEAAAVFLRRAVDKEPNAFWPNFYLALAAHRRGHPDEAVSGFSTCLAVAENRHGLCYYNRAVAHEAIGNLDAAARDLDRAVDLEPELSAAVFRRGVVRFRLGRWEEASHDLDRALLLGHDPAAVWYHLALVRRAAGDLSAAASCASEALKRNPANPRFRTLSNELKLALTQSR